MEEEFNISEFKSMINFKELFFKILGYWPLYVISLVICFAVAYSVNVRKQNVYRMSTQVVVSKAENPFFSSSTSLTFNWGGGAEKVHTTTTLLKSRTHNEKVVEYLQFYIKYQKQAEYWPYDAYKKAPFLVKIDSTHVQLVGKQISVAPISATAFELSINFKTPNVRVFHYGAKKYSTIAVTQGVFTKKYSVNEPIVLPFMAMTFMPYLEIPFSNQEFKVSLSDFNGTVVGNRAIAISSSRESPAILNLSKGGTNKNRIVDYLNASVKVLSRDELERKNIFATNTIKFVDSMLFGLKKQVKANEDAINNFKKRTKSLDLKADASKLSKELSTVDLEKELIAKKLDYLSELEKYLKSNRDYKNVPAPSITGVDEANIVSNVGGIISLSVERSKYEFTLREGAPKFAELDRDINSLKTVLLENIKAYRSALGIELRAVNRKLSKVQEQFEGLPSDQQEYIKIERKYALSSGLYDMFLTKRTEAGLIKAANVSDLLVIDEAKDVGDGAVGPNHKFNYVLALSIGLLFPTGIVVLLFLLSNKISGPKDIEFLSKIPILGVVGKSKSSLVVFERSKSPVSEAFRSIRSGLEFIYKKQSLSNTSKTVLLTSSVSGEGKTFTSINIASLYAMSNKKTVLLGLDLRKPKIIGDFNLINDFGVVNYLIGDKSISEIVQKTHIPNLDLISSGPVPPNPSELLISDEMDVFMEQLKKEYDYIIMDTPPLGLVTDALDLTKYSDANLYMVRQDYTEKGMLGLINDKYKNGEIKNLSFVLNYFKLKSGYGYGYGYGYGAYGESYHEMEEEEGELSNFLISLKRLFKK